METIVGWLAARDWNLDNPLGDCARALERPRLFDRLSAADAAGAHHALTYLEVDRKIAPARFDDVERHRFALLAGTWTVLRHEGRIPGIEREDAAHRFVELDAWHRHVLTPARSRFAAAMWKHRDREWFEANRQPWTALAVACGESQVGSPHSLRRTA